MMILNSSAYQFISLASHDLPAIKKSLQHTATQLSLKGTILLSPEGINLALAGTLPAMEQFKHYVHERFPFIQLAYNDTYSNQQPFQHLFIKLKKQIIPYSDHQIPLKQESAPYIIPHQLLTWLQNERDMVLLDARNQYEIESGSFKNALSLGLKQFRDFPEQLAKLPKTLKQKTVVTFCTGGIRCEKASATLLQQGFQEVYQLQGGILSYFKECGHQYYQGSCFVFDEREVVEPHHTKET